MTTAWPRAPCLSSWITARCRFKMSSPTAPLSWPRPVPLAGATGTGGLAATAGMGADVSLPLSPVLSALEVLAAGVTLLGGVAHLVAHGVAHRDIKPDNILIAPSRDLPPLSFLSHHPALS